MITLKGKSVNKGIAQGKVVYFKRTGYTVRHSLVTNLDSELSRLNIALKVTGGELESLYAKALSELGREDAEIFRAYQTVLRDEVFITDIRRMIETDHVNAEYAVQEVTGRYAGMFSEMQDEIFKSKDQDLYEVADRVIRVLNNTKGEMLKLTEESIVIADDLTPGELINLDKDKLIGIVLYEGSPHSHVAIISRTLNIPAVIGVENAAALSHHSDDEEDTAIVDGYEGRIYINPTDEVKRQIELKTDTIEVEQLKLNSLKGLPNETINGRRVEIYANIGSLEELGQAVENDAHGIGLFRTEFVFLNRNVYPSEEEQFEIYKAAAERMEGRVCVIRTLDVGSDKHVRYLGFRNEANPAMGYRAVRISLMEPVMFKAQVKAILRASHYGNVAFMVPLVISVEEVKRVKKIIEECKTELKSAGLPFDEKCLFGVMIETPAAALISDRLAKEVDFFSIGTNDLTQYTLAIDRESNILDEFLDTHHEAVMKLIEITVKNAKEAGIQTGICGELASDLSLTTEFVKMGVDAFSVYPSMVLPLRSKIRGINV
ncbi:MAG: phosphoenolpyruvate--protein phosphotransferase [Lachnospiraceae bacterium]|nr:phosphoenolpyruvate--protein phosphotransferase [Lachnospiraceae bacterium]